METLQLAQLRGYRTGGTIHIIINNQIGFTTSPESGRSSIYSTDVARMTQSPIFHINGDDPEAAYRTMRLALDYRQKYHKDVVLDVVGFRRLGHNESDEPSYTQPLMYQRVKEHPGVRTVYAKRLIKEGVVEEAGVNQLIAESERQQKDEMKAQLVSLEAQLQNLHSNDLAKIATRIQEHQARLKTLERDIDRREGFDLTDILFSEVSKPTERTSSGGGGD